MQASKRKVAERQAAKVLAVELQKVEGVQHGLANGAAPVQRVEDGDAIRSAYDCLAIESERSGAQQGRGDGNRRVAAGPVVAAPREEPHTASPSRRT
jgi:hypothetical protein